MTLRGGRAGMNPGAGAEGEADLAEPWSQVNRPAGALFRSRRGAP
jgi:hypothetical protein